MDKTMERNAVLSYWKNKKCHRGTIAGFAKDEIIRDEIRRSAQKKYSNVLSSYTPILSLINLKKKNIIEIDNKKLDGRWRDVLNDAYETYGIKNEINDTPIFSEGVIKQKIHPEEIYYIHYMTEIQDDVKMSMLIDVYVLSGGIFCFIGELKVDDVYLRENKIDGSISAIYGLSVVEEIIEREKLSLFSENEMDYLRIVFSMFPDIEDFMENVVNCVTRTFRAINYLTELKNEQCNESGKHKKIDTRRQLKSTIINSQELKDDGRNQKTIFIDDIKISINDSDKIHQRKTSEIIRRTGVWEVCGHYRTYRNGKRVYVNGYRKGPDRNKECKTKTTLRIV